MVAAATIDAAHPNGRAPARPHRAPLGRDQAPPDRRDRCGVRRTTRTGTCRYAPPRPIARATVSPGRAFQRGGWPRTRRPSPDRAALGTRAHPERPEEKLHELAVGKDGRNRAVVGLPAPRARDQGLEFALAVFGPAKWTRGLIKPNPGRAVAYLDYATRRWPARCGGRAMPAAIPTSPSPTQSAWCQRPAVRGRGTPQDPLPRHAVACRPRAAPVSMHVHRGARAAAATPQAPSPRLRENIERLLLGLARRSRWHPIPAGSTSDARRRRSGAPTAPTAAAPGRRAAAADDQRALGAIGWPSGMAVEEGLMICAPVHALLLEATANEAPAPGRGDRGERTRARQGQALPRRPGVVYPDRCMDKRGP